MPVRTLRAARVVGISRIGGLRVHGRGGGPGVDREKGGLSLAQEAVRFSSDPVAAR